MRTILDIFKKSKECKACKEKKALNKFRKQTRKRDITYIKDWKEDKRIKGKVVKKDGNIFSVSISYNGTCKECANKKKRAYNQLPEIKEKNRAYYKNENVKENRLLWRSTEEQKNKKAKRGKIYRQIKEVKDRRRKYFAEYEKNRKATDPIYDMKKRLRRLICTSLSRKGYTKKSRTHQILGIDYNEFAKYIEKQFVNGMNWDNRKEWHLDHIVPISFAQNEEDIRKLNHYTNFRPLWAEENMKRSNNINYQISWR